mgnify:CR=1 FL=1
MHSYLTYQKTITYFLVKGGDCMEIATIYYIVKFLLDLYKAKKHSNTTKSTFSFKLETSKFNLEINSKKYYIINIS